MEDSTEMTVQKLEAESATIRVDVAIIASNYATRADIAKAMNNMIIWAVSALLLTQLLNAGGRIAGYLSPNIFEIASITSCA